MFEYSSKIRPSIKGYELAWATLCIDFSYIVNWESVDLFLTHWWKGREDSIGLALDPVARNKTPHGICVQTRVGFPVLLHSILPMVEKPKSGVAQQGIPQKASHFISTPAQSRMTNDSPAQSRFYIFNLYKSAGAVTNGRIRESICLHAVFDQHSHQSRSERTKNNNRSFRVCIFLYICPDFHSHVHKSCYVRTYFLLNLLQTIYLNKINTVVDENTN